VKSLFSAAVLLAVAFTNAHAQQSAAGDETLVEWLRVDQDKDGAANVRVGASPSAKVLGTVTSGKVVLAYSTTGDWTNIETDEVSGADFYVHSSRLGKLTDWKQISSAKNDASDRSTIHYDRAEVNVTAVPFAKKDHKVTPSADGQILVDGRSPWGTDGTLPTHSLALSVKLDGQSLAIPASATRDLFQPELTSLTLLTPGKPSEQMAIVMQNSDGAGFYIVAWSFVKGRYAGRTIMHP
jgi:hypothetical protein